MTFPGQEPIVKKGKLDPVDITLALKTYNKKVILKISGLKLCSSVVEHLLRVC